MNKNKLMEAAQDALYLVAQMRSENRGAVSIDAMVKAVELFRDNLSNQHPSKAQEASLVICAALDEAYRYSGDVLELPKISLCSQFHNTTHAGEIIFDRIAVYLMNPGKNQALLQLSLYCLATGFKGKYAVLEGGVEELLSIRMKIFNALSDQGCQDLVPKPRLPLLRRWFMPYVPVLVLSLGLVIGGYGYFAFKLKHQINIAKNNVENVYFGHIG